MQPNPIPAPKWFADYLMCSSSKVITLFGLGKLDSHNYRFANTVASKARTAATNAAPLYLQHLQPEVETTFSHST